MKTETRLKKKLELHGYSSIEEMLEAAINGTLPDTREITFLEKFTRNPEVSQLFGPMTTRVVRKKVRTPDVADDQYNDDAPTKTKASGIKQVIEITLNNLSKPIAISIDLQKRFANVQFSKTYLLHELREKRELVTSYLKKFFLIENLLCEVA